MDKSGPSHVARALDGTGSESARRLAQGFRIGCWLVQPGLCTAIDGSRTEQLEPKVMGVLLCLAQHAPQVVTREQFIRDVWNGRPVTDQVLSRSISLLRTQLGDDAHEPKFIRTIPRIGYALVASVEGLGTRVAVLPFSNRNAARDTDYLAEGLSDELASRLSRFEGLQVVARTSVHHLEDSGDVRAIGKRLGATHLVRGDVTSGEGRLRVAIQVLDAGSGEIGRETLEGDLADVFALHADVATTAARLLSVGGQPRQRSMPRALTRNLEAYQSYLRGLQQLKRRGASAIGSSIELFSEAVALDPGFSMASVSLAYAYTLLPSYARVDARLMYSHADAALASVAGDPDAETAAVGIRAVIETRRGHWIEAEESFRRALSANPGNSEIRQWYSQLQGAVGNLAAGLRQAQQALDDDPLSPILNFRVAVALLWNDLELEAERQFAVSRELGLEQSVTPEAFTMLLVRQGRFDDLLHAFSEIQRSRRQSDQWVGPVVAAIRERGLRPAVETVIEGAYANGQMGWVMYFGTLVLTGHGERAIEALLARPVLNPSDLELLFAHEAAELRESGAFSRLRQQAGLDAYRERFSRTGDQALAEPEAPAPPAPRAPLA